MKKLLISLLFLFFVVVGFSQTSSIQGIVTSSDNSPIVGVNVNLSGTNLSTQTNEEGVFLFENLKLGDYQIIISKTDYENYFSETISVEEGVISDLGTIKLIVAGSGSNDGAVVLVNADDLNNEQGSENISSLLHGSQDVFLNSAAYALGPMRFRVRGYDSDFTDITINGLAMSNMEMGRTFWSNWGGLNNITKYKNVTFGLDAIDNSFGNIGGNTDLQMKPTKYRKGLQLTYSRTNRSYNNRVMATYSTGLMKNNWAFAFSGSRRWSQEGYVEGTFYDAWAYYVGIEKHIKNQKIILNVFGAPKKRGKNGGSTQEAYDLVGNVYYNPYWGYQNGEKRNSRIASYHKPTIMLTHEWDINQTTKLRTNAAFRFGQNGSTALNWYNAADPRPDYYRYLPSYITNNQEALSVGNAFANDSTYSQINWSEMYFANQNSYDEVNNVDGIEGQTVTGNKAQYMIEERRYDQIYMAFNSVLNKEFSDKIKVDAGIEQRYFIGKNFKVINDLLGADYWLDIDKYAERDLQGHQDSIQSDMNTPNHVVYEGDIFGYNYESHVQESKLWSQFTFDTRKINFFVAAYGSYTSMWRVGNMKNGKFPNSSEGPSEKLNFIDYGGKTGLLFRINGRNFIHGHAAYMTKAPTFRSIYVSPRTRNNTVSNPVSQKIISADIGYSLKAPKIKITFNAFYTQFKDQSRTMSFYHDGYRNFVNYAMSGIDKTHQGLEFAIEGTIFTGFSAYGVGSFGYYRWTSRPTVTVTVDNSAEILAENKTFYAQNFLVSGTPQTAGSVGLKYRTSSYWFFNVNANYVDDIYLSFNPERRTTEAVEYVVEDTELWNSIVDQTQLPSGYTIDASIGKSFRIDYKYYISLNLNVNNILNNNKIITGGYEQLRYDVEDKDPNKFPPKLYYLYGRQFYLNLSFRF